MNFFLFALVTVLACGYVADAIFDGGVISGSALAGLIGLKIVAGIGFGLGAALGSRRRSGGRRSRYHRRSVEEDSFATAELLAKASLDDADDCAKRLVCEVNAKDTLDADESAVRALFAASDELDVASPSVQFDLAAVVGRKAGAAQCRRVYARCPYEEAQLMTVLRQPINYV